jgi:hypothetical protein
MQGGGQTRLTNAFAKNFVSGIRLLINVTTKHFVF